MNYFVKLTNYLKDSKKELKKVIWPSKKETIKHTLIVVVVSLVTAIFLGVLDFIFQLGLQKII